MMRVPEKEVARHAKILCLPKLNHYAFEKRTVESSYWAGVLYSKGIVTSPFKLRLTDSYIVNGIARFIKYKPTIPKYGKVYHLVFESEEMEDHLRAYGSKDLPDLSTQGSKDLSTQGPKDLSTLPFIKGLIDGNGGTRLHCGNFEIYFNGPEILQGLIQSTLGIGCTYGARWIAKGNKNIRAAAAALCAATPYTHPHKWKAL